MKRINITRDVESRRNISQGRPAPQRVVDEPVTETPKEENAKSEEVERTSPDPAPRQTEKPKKRERQAKENV